MIILILDKICFGRRRGGREKESGDNGGSPFVLANKVVMVFFKSEKDKENGD